MDGMDFYSRVGEHKQLGWLGCKKGDTPDADVVYVKFLGTDRCFAVPITEILVCSWSTLERILTGKRNGRVLSHWSRIVGYWSARHNWNRSKIAEGNDRNKGSYIVPDARKMPDLFPDEDFSELTAEALVAGGAEYVCEIPAEKT